MTPFAEPGRWRTRTSPATSTLKWLVLLFGTLLALTIVIPSLNPGDLLAGLGIGSVAIGFAFKDILQN